MTVRPDVDDAQAVKTLAHELAHVLLHTPTAFAVGAVPSPFDCYMVLRGLKTLGVRMRQHVQSARTIASFLTLVWRQGALFGETPEKAFYVKCDEETNPPETIDVGQLIVEIGLAPVKPAEFVIFRIGQMPTGGGVEE